MAQLQVLDEQTAALVASLCELIVPGCRRIGAEVYVDALLARMPPDARTGALTSFAALEGPLAEASTGDSDEDSAALSELALTPDFGLVRSLACEAFYSDFVAPGAVGPGAWQEIDFASPLATRLSKDWSYLEVRP